MQSEFLGEFQNLSGVIPRSGGCDLFEDSMPFQNLIKGVHRRICLALADGGGDRVPQVSFLVELLGDAACQENSNLSKARLLLGWQASPIRVESIVMATLTIFASSEMSPDE